MGVPFCRVPSGWNLDRVDKLNHVWNPVAFTVGEAQGFVTREDAQQMPMLSSRNTRFDPWFIGIWTGFSSGYFFLLVIFLLSASALLPIGRYKKPMGVSDASGLEFLK